MKKIISTLLVCILLCGCIFALTACGAPDSDPKAAAEALEGEGYDVTLTENTKGYAATIVAIKNNIKDKEYDYVEIYYFDSEEAANEAWEKLEAQFAEEAAVLDGTDYEIEYGKSGAVIYKGTPDAVDAAN